MGKQTSIFDVINKEDDSLEGVCNYIRAEVKNLNYLRRCLQWLVDYERDGELERVLSVSVKGLESSTYWLTLIGFNVEASKSGASISKENIDKWTKLSELPDDLGGGEGKGYQEIFEALLKTTERVRSRVMAPHLDNIARVDDARRMYMLFMDSISDGKNGIGLAGLKKL